MRILLSESKDFSSEALQLLRAVGDVRCLDGSLGTLLRELPHADALWVRLKHYIDQAILDAGPRLKYLITNTTGLTHIDLQSVESRGIRVFSLRGETEFLRSVRSTAELTVGLALALARRIPAAHSHVIQGGWDRDLFKGRELSGLNAGVLGYGRLGRMVADCLGAFGMQVRACDPFVDPATVTPSLPLVSLSELLAASDVVTIHVNYNEANAGFFDDACFSQMRPGALLINTSRGELIQEHALLRALQSNRLGGAALDVLSEEHLLLTRYNPVVAYAAQHDNLLITPHIGGCTREGHERTEVFLARKFCDYVRAGKNA